MHHLFRRRDRHDLLTAVLDAGITHFDTARMYGEGMAERELGLFLGRRRQDVTIGTKFGTPAIPVFERWPLLMYANKAAGIWRPGPKRTRALSPGDAENSLRRSLSVLRTDWIDVLFVHEPQETEIDQLLALSEWLYSQKRKGRVLNIGLAGSAACCAEVVRQTGDLFDILQVEDTCARLEGNEIIELGWPLQITFGYLRRALAGAKRVEPLEVLRSALRRNAHGMILVSTRNPKRVRQLADATQEG